MSGTTTWREVRAEAVRSGRLDEERVAAHKERLMAEERAYRTVGAAAGPPLVHPGEFLRAEFLKPLGLSVGSLAECLRVPVDRVEAIVRC